MGDYAAGSVIVYECPVDKRPEAFAAITELMSSLNVGADFGLDIGTELVLGGSYTDDEIRVGFEGALGPELEALGASYLINASGKYEYDPCTRMYTPSLGVFEGVASSYDDTIMVGSATIMGAIAATVSRDGLVERLMDRTGQAWFDYFAAVIEGQPAPTMAEMVAARTALSRIQEELT